MLSKIETNNVNLKLFYVAIQTLINYTLSKYF